MTKDQKIEVIRQACIEANPAIVLITDNWTSTNDRDDEQYTKTERPIRLADVLLAIDQGEGCTITSRGEFCQQDTPVGFDWNLRSDSLTEQSDETIDFIFNLLKHDK